MRPHPRYAEVDPDSPRGWARCDRCSFITNLYKLQWQMAWRGIKVDNTRILVCDRCVDDLQRQLGAIILPPDPPPLVNARPEQYTMDEITFRVTQSGQQRYQMDGTARIESNVQSGTGTAFDRTTTGVFTIGSSSIGVDDVIP